MYSSLGGGRWQASSQDTQGTEESGAERLVGKQREIALPGVTRVLSGKPEESGTEPFGLSPVPPARETKGPENVQKLVGQRAQPPEQGVAAQVIDGRASHSSPEAVHASPLGRSLSLASRSATGRCDGSEASRGQES